MLVALGDLVGLGDVVGLDGSESHAQALASLPQQLEGVGGGALRGGALRISPVFLDEMNLQGCGDFVGRLQRVVDGPVPCSVVNHGASIAPLRASVVLGTHLPGVHALHAAGAEVLEPGYLGVQVVGVDIQVHAAGPSPRRWVSSQKSWPCSAAPWYSGWSPNGCGSGWPRAASQKDTSRPWSLAGTSMTI